MAPLDGTMGPLLIGVIICAVFYGVSVSQVFYYFTRYPHDPLYLKLLVFAVWVTDTVHQGLISHTVYWYFVTTYGDPTALGRLAPTIIIEVYFNAFTALFVQSFFAMRIYRLSGKKMWLVVPVVMLIGTEFGIIMAYSIKALAFKTFIDLTKLKDLSVSINAFAAAGDVCIAAILCTILQTSKTGFSKSNHIINRLMVFSVNTGLLTSICACISLITILALPNTFVYICFFFLMGRLYSNSLMATLNARKGIREASSKTHDNSLSLQNIHPTGHGIPTNFSKTDTSIAIRIDTTKDTQHDADFDYQSTHYSNSDKRPIED
ncbi:hypothetical protein DICSQDRAFT_158751 [Dichomitus squalens LYAD-421 SS1]|uniref:DUF6534 domain-containing protein n=1 Tax=Dichomitus squalens TaxID=114155 RepID=A0A4Q9Q5C7_9APHY|nr:uncharacterized protein DICSQDRAFT_158751 [Dichomitus squalens LYAD-421 SS1]EJF67269.1 hypothetical protein DICSQDRAFT_158751 [Dichomitus squalens LYAD-421 SS1]TBU62572.1 hypothetical protein BD310DRAFT_918703 [Dichomitus squalens]